MLSVNRVPGRTRSASMPTTTKFNVTEDDGEVFDYSDCQCERRLNEQGVMAEGLQPSRLPASAATVKALPTGHGAFHHSALAIH